MAEPTVDKVILQEVTQGSGERNAAAGGIDERPPPCSSRRPAASRGPT